MMLEKINHTPKPWYPSYRGFGAVVSVNKPNSCLLGAEDAKHYGGYLICESVSNKGDQAVISHAPEMYEVLHDFYYQTENAELHGETLSFRKRIEEILMNIHLMGERS